jgi:type I restriction enzyme M protein
MRYVDLMDKEAAAGKQIKDAQKALDAQVEAKYGALVEAGIRTLVVEDKWLAAVADGVQAELDRTSRALTDRIRVLAERYARPLPELVGEVEGLSAKVAGHLRKMGAVWS